MMLTLRPHHVLCLAGRAAGIDTQAFTQNFDALCAHLRGPNGASVRMRITLETDDICQACPYAHGSTCDFEADVLALDQLHAELLDIQDGEVYTFGELRRRLLRHMHDRRLDAIVAQGPRPLRGAAQEALGFLRDHAEPPVRG